MVRCGSQNARVDLLFGSAQGVWEARVTRPCDSRGLVCCRLFAKVMLDRTPSDAFVACGSTATQATLLIGGLSSAWINFLDIAGSSLHS